MSPKNTLIIFHPELISMPTLEYFHTDKRATILQLVGLCQGGRNRRITTQIRIFAFKIIRGNYCSLSICFRRKSQVYSLYKTIMWSSILRTILTRFIWNGTHGGS
uniref:Uncharacterized protein n=1 Tax=Triticum urartu TaxID=4572 RepID=A0A8R7TKC4_TRIUA